MFLNRDPLNVRLNLKRVSFVVIKISQIKITHINMNWRHDVATKIWRAADVVTRCSLNICGEKTWLYILLKLWTPLTLWLIIKCWNFHLNQAVNSNFITFVLELLDNPTYMPCYRNAQIIFFNYRHYVSRYVRISSNLFIPTITIRATI